MKNLIVCRNCSHENNFYDLNCRNCKAILRPRVVNIDLWQTIWKLVESPSNAFKEVIQSEHKNFIFLLLFLIGLRFATLSFIFSNIVRDNQSAIEYLIGNVFLSVIYSAVIFVFFAFIMKILTALMGVSTRFKDNFSVLLYSFMPQLISLIVILPIIYGLFGQYWFIYNPSPFALKPVAAYIITGIEGFLTIYSLVLLIIAIKVQTRSIVFSIVFGVLAEGCFLLSVVYIPLIPFVS